MKYPGGKHQGGFDRYNQEDVVRTNLRIEALRMANTTPDLDEVVRRAKAFYTFLTKTEKTETDKEEA